MNKAVDTSGKPLVAGKWYCIGFEMFSMVDTPEMNWGEIIQYCGNDEWIGGNGEPVYHLYDPELQMPVSCDAADGYALQG